MTPRTVHVAVGVVLLLCAGCPTESASKQTRDGGPRKVRAECDAPSTKCYKDCFKREASEVCTGCCFNQLILCDEGNRYSFESCTDVP